MYSITFLRVEVENMDKWLSPREAAEMIGINPDTLRRWGRDGVIKSERTPGGQRRYREEDVLALLNCENPTSKSQSRETSKVAEASDREEIEVDEVRPRPMPSWECRLKEEAADVEVIKLRRQKAALIRAEQEERDERARQETRRKQELARREVEAANEQRKEAADRQRLANLRTYGNSLAIAAPPEHQAKVARDLLSSVNAKEYPAELSLYLAYNQVSNRVTQLLESWRESQERERAKAEQQQKLNNLTNSGLSYARTETWEWEREDRTRALREVELALTEDVEPTWTIDDVRDLVDELLDEWDEE